MIKLRPYQLEAIQQSFDALKINDDPVLLECSVGGGKSYIIASIAKKLSDSKRKILCLVSSAELVRNNSHAFKDFGGEPSIFCSSLRSKQWENNVVFATPQSVVSALKSNHAIKDVKFNIIIVDEAHTINFNSDASIFMKILRHYKHEYWKMRVLGLTGTPFRGDTSIVGENAFFKTKVGNISTQYLINNGYLVKPVFESPKTQGFDFSKCRVNNLGEFNQSDLQYVINGKRRLTWKILKEVQNIMAKRHVIIIFCSTKSHCFEALEALPPDETRIILGDTADDIRNETLTLAREGKIKWLISVNCLLTGVNVPLIDGVVWLRPTSSLLLFIQGIGRGLRLHNQKQDCLVLDYASNVSRFSDIDDPIINEAIQPRGNHEEEERPFKCWKCSTYNTLFSRRCIGMVDGKRCDHFFEFKACPSCHMQSDITARACRGCGQELIDPNAKLSTNVAETYELTVIEANYWITTQGNSGSPVIYASYQCKEGKILEKFYTSTEKARGFTYGNFIRLHSQTPSKYYKLMYNRYQMKQMISEHDFKTPSVLICKKNNHGILSVVSKKFL